MVKVGARKCVPDTEGEREREKETDGVRGERERRERRKCGVQGVAKVLKKRCIIL